MTVKGKEDRLNLDGVFPSGTGRTLVLHTQLQLNVHTSQ